VSSISSSQREGVLGRSARNLSMVDYTSHLLPDLIFFLVGRSWEIFRKELLLSIVDKLLNMLIIWKLPYEKQSYM
jgi:hypothetical protein